LASPLQHAALLCLALLIAPQQGDSKISFPARPPAGSYVVDEAELLDDVQEREINAIAAEQMRLRRVPMLVVTIRSLDDHDAAGYTIEQYARALFDAWGIGSPEHNYGIAVAPVPRRPAGTDRARSRVGRIARRGGGAATG